LKKKGDQDVHTIRLCFSQKKPNVHFGGRSISHVIQCEDGSQKTLGVILPTDQPLTFETHVAEHIEIISGQCQVKIGLQTEMRLYHAGESFDVPAALLHKDFITI